jgi:hypothetical protein
MFKSVVGPFVMYYDDNRQHRPLNSSTHRPCACFGIHNNILSRNTRSYQRVQGYRHSKYIRVKTRLVWQTSRTRSLAIIDRCIAASIKVRIRQKATRHLRSTPSETATFASVIYRFAITVVVHPTDAGVVLRKLSSRLTDLIENNDQHSVPRRSRHDANRLRKKSKQLQHTLLAPVKGAKCGKWLRHSMAHHMVRQAILVEAGKIRASFTSRRGPLGGRPPWSVITNLLVLEEIRPIVRLWLNASSCVACARPRSN